MSWEVVVPQCARFEAKHMLACSATYILPARSSNMIRACCVHEQHTIQAVRRLQMRWWKVVLARAGLVAAALLLWAFKSSGT